MNRIIIMALLCLIILQVHAQSTFEYVKKNTMEGTKVSLINKKTGVEILPPIYDNITEISYGKCAIVKDGKVGYADTAGKIIVPVQYADGLGFFNNRTFVSNGKKWAMIDDKGKLITQFLYDDVLGMSEGIGRVVIAKKIGFVNSSGVQILSCKFTEAYDCKFNLILTYSTAQEVWGTTVVYGKTVDVGATSQVPVIYNSKGIAIFKGAVGESIKYTNDGHFTVINSSFNAPYKDCHKLLDNTGKVIIPYEMRYYMRIMDNYIKVEQGYKYGIMAFDGTMILKPNFHSISPFDFKKGELAKVYFDPNKFFYVDRNWKCAILRWSDLSRITYFINNLIIRKLKGSDTLPFSFLLRNTPWG